MKTMAIILFILSLSASSEAQTPIVRDNTANIGDKLDDNEIPAEQELRLHEYPNRPDNLDKNKTPAKLEERQREEEIEPYNKPHKYKIYKLKNGNKNEESE